MKLIRRSNVMLTSKWTFKGKCTFKGPLSGKHAIRASALRQETEFRVFLNQTLISDSKNLYPSFFWCGELEKQGFRSNRDRQDNENKRQTLGDASNLNNLTQF